MIIPSDGETLQFYDREAERYCARTTTILSPELPGFLRQAAGSGLDS